MKLSVSKLILAKNIKRNNQYKRCITEKLVKPG